MARLPQSRKLLAEDFRDQPWIAPLLASVNQFMDDVNGALKQGLTINDNFMGKIITVEVNGTFPVKVRWDLAVKPLSVVVGDWYRRDGATRETVLVTDGDTASSKTISNLSSTTGLRAGLLVTGSGIPDNTHIVSVDSSSAITISKVATATAANVTLTFEYDESVQVRWTYNQAGQLSIEDVLGIDPSSTNKFILVLECKAG